ncbi:MAG: hypothetical protein H8D22_05820 [Candidatus Cloacimonetes bacterium]|nr:hypothetical protein [Candidatus Cloacimonadota bacterium]
MKIKVLYNPISVLAIFSTVLLIFNMIGILISKEQIFTERDKILTGVEIIILFGFGLILLSNILSIIWLLLRFRHSEKITIREKVTLALGCLCLLLLIGDKTMIHEIGREYSLGWETLGEWIILYVFLAIQLLYNFIFLMISKNTPHNNF